ncbi:MAG: hypothetical protein A2268_02435 [Candidatus Raymondbacteria bacterium RifOxyA12_full_50_37]|uniref:histidine kinase n=1 Tax=Candidatus Raymondbacteria bacterium RIFOXYD12_FULL_49_13 TaxID=1817890 RepID=A0A1F7F317_UNCRA|nr:MAG: hypothetical protein A2268_02435 [Candidatus Raymondbacteria bacterium RifOxyA12_full_50_37]OGJ89141.1 MAG: hypothetical protein A2248_11330 [Candidatus Raymondbacteria bacterium RIFOXYA2_FULL_49_16]OGJ96509.1 MAG: hypothetical protein A2350_05040 [Candidatus Raymondbacteria bacterium RifOxyB12_full_50_8]OGJ96623.1 MAG: hypothetical protein A2453_06445 [Candidatus Raymondbacteria bacterium RIFOXYC2_FULL_50_21]OGK01074.1 MAG: hypothetical protein A2519_16925 [Candidatus Raymondbacteria b
MKKIICTTRDITERKQLEEELKKSEIRSAEIVDIFEDITEQKQTDTERLKQHEALLHMGRSAAMNELATSLAHEINQPLAAILSNAQSILRFLDAEKPDMDEVRDALKDIMDDNRRISAVIKELRNYLKKGEIKREPLDMAGLLEEVLVLSHSDLAIRSITIQKAFDPNLPKVLGNRVQIQQVILNLVMNGCDAMEKAASTDRMITVSAGTDNSGNVLVDISDCGHGFSKTESSKAFETFFTTKPNGLGLGLATCKSIVESHGGRLSVRNNPDKGATVSFTLPIHTGNP